MRLLFVLVLIGILTVSGCQQEELPRLNFFEVETGEVRLREDATFGRVTVTGSLDIKGGPGLPLVNIDRYGFLWATAYEALANQTTDTIEISFGDYRGDDTTFLALSPPLDPNRTYYYQAFAQSGKRFMRGGIRSTELDVVLGVRLRDRINDKMILEAEIGNIGNSTIPAFGIVLSALTPTPSLENSDLLFFDTILTNLTQPTILGVDVDSLSFNTDYYARAFCRTIDSIYYSESLKIEVTDGWQYVGNIPPGVGATVDVTTAVVNNNVHLLGGRASGLNFSDQHIVFQVEPGQVGGQWNTQPDLESPFSAGGVLQWDDLIVYGNGRLDIDNSFVWRNLDSDLQRFCDPTYAMPKLYNGVTFVAEGNGYIGTGRWVDSTTVFTNQFWRVSRGPADCIEMLPDTPLPVRFGDQVLEEEGRIGAVAFQLGDRFYVGGGRYRFGDLNDLYCFQPGAANEAGTWEYKDDLPGHARQEAIAIVHEGKLYYGFGFNAEFGYLKDFYEFDPLANNWTATEPFPGVPRAGAFGFSIAGNIYMGGGQSAFPVADIQITPSYPSDFWTYIPATDE